MRVCLNLDPSRLLRWHLWRVLKTILSEKVLSPVSLVS